jgi:hypothetical protein
MTSKIFLDDLRRPEEAFFHTNNPIYNEGGWKVAKSYVEFTSLVDYLISRGDDISLISFDHDLDNEHCGHLYGTIPYDTFKMKTGYHCAKWLINKYPELAKTTEVLVHSMNPQGTINIKQLFDEHSTK